MRRYYRFTWKEANFRISSAYIDIVKEEIKKQRKLLEEYIRRHPAFGSSFSPVPLYPRAPEIARRMARASRKGTGSVCSALSASPHAMQRIQPAGSGSDWRSAAASPG